MSRAASKRALKEAQELYKPKPAGVALVRQALEETDEQVWQKVLADNPQVLPETVVVIREHVVSDPHGSQLEAPGTAHGPTPPSDPPNGAAHLSGPPSAPKAVSDEVRDELQKLQTLEEAEDQGGAPQAAPINTAALHRESLGRQLADARRELQKLREAQRRERCTCGPRSRERDQHKPGCPSGPSAEERERSRRQELEYRASHQPVCNCGADESYGTSQQHGHTPECQVRRARDARIQLALMRCTCGAARRGLSIHAPECPAPRAAERAFTGSYPLTIEPPLPLVIRPGPSRDELFALWNARAEAEERARVALQELRQRGESDPRMAPIILDVTRLR